MRKIFISLVFISSCVSSPITQHKENFTLTIMDEIPSFRYSRKDWKHWIDADGDCQDTREEVLIEESVIPVTFKDERHCTVLSGEWHDPYTGEVFSDPRLLDVDHLVPLAEASRSGGYLWDKEKKMSYANDLSNPQHLIAVKASVNRKKGDKDPAHWLPPLESYRCKYVMDWIEIKLNYKLAVDSKENAAIQDILAHCN